MKPILEALRQEGTQALHRSIWILCGGILAVSAVLFAAAALAVGLAEILPLYAAIACSAALLSVIALGCFLMAGRNSRPHHERAADPAPAPSRVSDIALQLLEAEIRAKPGKTALAAVVAGLILGALEALERSDSDHPPPG